MSRVVPLLSRRSAAGHCRREALASAVLDSRLDRSSATMNRVLFSAAMAVFLLSGCVAVSDRLSATPSPRCPMGHQDKRSCMPDSGRGLCQPAPGKSDC